ncbi:MAG: hypothetical protein Q8Q12_00650 [bacterium]|nr:hypothetical protein [bacterium]
MILTKAQVEAMRTKWHWTEQDEKDVCDTCLAAMDRADAMEEALANCRCQKGCYGMQNCGLCPPCLAALAVAKRKEQGDGNSK